MRSKSAVALLFRNARLDWRRGGTKICRQKCSVRESAPPLTIQKWHGSNILSQIRPPIICSFNFHTYSGRQILLGWIFRPFQTGLRNCLVLFVHCHVASICLWPLTGSSIWFAGFEWWILLEDGALKRAYHAILAFDTDMGQHLHGSRHSYSNRQGCRRFDT